MIEAQNLSKTFSGIHAVKDVSFRIEVGEIVAMLGPNGAGKTTCMRLLSGYYRPDVGYATLAGFDSFSQTKNAKQSMGYLPEHAPIYKENSVLNYLRFIAQARGLTAQSVQRGIDELFEKLSLHSIAHQRISTLSKGSMRRVALAAAVIHKPAVLLLDEPTDGLDPIQKVQVRNLIAELSKHSAILMSTHQIDEVISMCPRTMILAQGQKVTDKSTDELLLLSKYHNAVSFIAKESIAARAALDGLSGISGFEQNAQDGRLYVFVQGSKPQNQWIAERLTQKNVPFQDLRLEYGRLDEVFQKLVSEAKL